VFGVLAFVLLAGAAAGVLYLGDMGHDTAGGGKAAEKKVPGGPPQLAEMEPLKVTPGVPSAHKVKVAPGTGKGRITLRVLETDWLPAAEAVFEPGEESAQLQLAPRENAPAGEQEVKVEIEADGSPYPGKLRIKVEKGP
jgi:hypothetical protein